MQPENNNHSPENKSNEDCNDDMIFRDEETRKKMEKHMSDPNDKITDEDIANVKTDVTPNTVIKPCDDSSSPEKNDDDSLTDNAEDTGSPWTVLE